MRGTPAANELFVAVRFIPAKAEVAVRYRYFAPGEQLGRAGQHVHRVHAPAHGEKNPAHFLLEKVQVKLKERNSLNCTL